MIDLSPSLETLSAYRPIFHSEADFQHAFAWQVQEDYPISSIRLERPFIIDGKQAHVDVLVSLPNSVTAIELKYKTRKLRVEHDQELFKLRNQSAQDLGRYDFLVDVQRVESLVKSGFATHGYAIMISNDSAYWKPPRNPRTIDADFRIHTGTTVHGCLSWSDRASTGTTKGREDTITIDGTYHLRWKDYSKPSSASYGSLRMLVVRLSLDQ